MRKIKYVFIIFLIICVTTAFEAKINRGWEFSITLLNDKTEKDNVVFLRNITNDRPEKQGKKNINQLGNTRGGYGNIFPLISQYDLIEITKEIVVNSLNYSGYEVKTENPDGKHPIIDIEVKEFFSDGYLYFYGIWNFYKIKLLTPDGNKIIYETEVCGSTSFLPNQFELNTLKFIEVWYIGFENIFQITTKNFINIFSSDLFKNVYLNEESNITNLIENQSNKKLLKIPENLTDSFSISFYNNKIEKIEKLENLESLENINFGINNIKIIENLEKLNKLKNISFSDNKISKIENLNTLTDIIDLNFHNNFISKIENLENLSKLKWLNISKNKINKIENLNNLKDLKWLNLGDNQISKIENLENQKNLVWLNLTNNKIGKIENLDNLINLQYLDLRNNPVKEIENINNLTNLKQLNISDTFITRLENLDNLNNLEIITFRKHQILTISNSTYNFLKTKNIKFFNLDIDSFIKKNFIKIKD